MANISCFENARKQCFMYRDFAQNLTRNTCQLKKKRKKRFFSFSWQLPFSKFSCNRPQSTKPTSRLPAYLATAVTAADEEVEKLDLDVHRRRPTRCLGLQARAASRAREPLLGVSGLEAALQASLAEEVAARGLHGVHEHLAARGAQQLRGHLFFKQLYVQPHDEESECHCASVCLQGDKHKSSHMYTQCWWKYTSSSEIACTEELVSCCRPALV